MTYKLDKFYIYDANIGVYSGSIHDRVGYEKDDEYIRRVFSQQNNSKDYIVCRPNYKTKYMLTKIELERTFQHFAGELKNKMDRKEVHFPAVVIFIMCHSVCKLNDAFVIISDGQRVSLMLI